MLINPLQLWKAELPMLVTSSGIVTLVKVLLPEKALSPINLVLLFIVYSVTVVVTLARYT